MSADAVYIKMLPNGEPRRITADGRPKYGLAFSPDGSQIAYTVMQVPSFATVTMSALGGEPHLLLTNAAALTWLDADKVLFSRIRSGLHMGIVTEAPPATTSARSTILRMNGPWPITRSRLLIAPPRWWWKWMATENGISAGLSPSRPLGRHDWWDHKAGAPPQAGPPTAAGCTSSPPSKAKATCGASVFLTGRRSKSPLAPPKGRPRRRYGWPLRHHRHGRA